MKKMQTILLQAIIGLVPVFYLLSLWNTLPNNLPMHYNMNFEADKFGSKTEVLTLMLFMFGLSIGTSLLVLNLEHFDPKKTYLKVKPLAIKISWVTVIFLSIISFYIVYEDTHYHLKDSSEIMDPKYIFAIVAMLIAVLGNYMNNIKPNYFVGIKTPWNLENEENWRKTHHLGSKLWFFGGLLISIFTLFLPTNTAAYVFMVGMAPLVIIPFAYSFYIFKQQQKTQV